MKKVRYLALAILLLGPAALRADDELDCGDQVKTCFMDGHSTSCICVDPPTDRSDPVAFVPPEGENPGPYEGGSAE